MGQIGVELYEIRVMRGKVDGCGAMVCSRCVSLGRVVIVPCQWNEMRRPGIFKTQGLVISGCGLK